MGEKGSLSDIGIKLESMDVADSSESGSSIANLDVTFEGEESISNIDLDLNLDDVSEDFNIDIEGFDIGDITEEVTAEDEITLTRKEEHSSIGDDEELSDERDYYESGEDITDSADYDFLREETIKFMSVLRTTLALRSNRMETLIVGKTPDIVSSEEIINKFKRTKGTNTSQRNMYIDTIRIVLDCVRKYNENKDMRVLPKSISSRMQDFETLSYNDPEGRIFDEIDTQIRIKLSGDGSQKKISKYMSDISSVRILYQKICDVYDKMDEEEYMSKMNRRKNEYRDSIKFALYNWVLDYLDSPDSHNPGQMNVVSLCNHLYYTNGDNVEFEFKCGKCGNIVSGATSIEIGDSGTEIKEGDTHTFYQFLTSGSKGLYYPMICEECGAINCFSSSTRKLIDEGMLRGVNEKSHDDIDYRDMQKPYNASMIVAGDRRMIPYSKYLDLLEPKIEAGEDGLGFDLDDMRTKSVIEDSQFFIEINSESVTDGILDDINESEYREAIIAFRKHNDVLMEKKNIDTIDVPSEKNKRLVLSLLSHSGNITFLRSMYESIAGYIIDTECAKELEDALNTKNELYDKYLTALGARKIVTLGKNISDIQKQGLIKLLDCDWTVESLTKAEKIALDDYNTAQYDYTRCRYRMLDNAKIYAFRKREFAPSSLSRLADIFDHDYVFVEFMESVMCEVVQNKLVNDINVALGVRKNGARVVSKKVQNIKNINDREHLISNKYKEVLEYCKRVQNVFGKFKMYGDFKSILTTLYNQCIQYTKYCEWRDMFALTDKTTFKGLTSRKNYDEILKGYNNWLFGFHGEIDQFIGKRIGELIPKFSDSVVFEVLFGSDIRSDKALMRDAKEAYGILFHTPSFKIFDIVASKIIISNIGYQEYAGFNNLDIARNLKLMNGSVLNTYKMCEESLIKSCCEESKVKFRLKKMIEHEYLFSMNNQSEVDCLKSLVYSPEDDVDVVTVGALTDDMIRQIDAIFEEVGDAEHINEEYATQDMITEVF